MFDPRAAAESGFEPEVKKVDGQYSQVNLKSGLGFNLFEIL